VNKQGLPTPEELYIRHGDAYKENLQVYYSEQAEEPKDYCWGDVRREMLFLLNMYALAEAAVKVQNETIAKLEKCIVEHEQFQKGALAFAHAVLHPEGEEDDD
jgi:hypothetical protein